MRDEAPDLHAIRLAKPPSLVLARGLPRRLQPALLALSRHLPVAAVEAPWPDADVAPLDTDDRDLRGDVIRATQGTIEGANALECRRVLITTTRAGDPLRFALDRLLPTAERHGVTLGLQGALGPGVVTALLAEFEGAPLGWLVDMDRSPDLAKAAGQGAVGLRLPTDADADADLGAWTGSVPPTPLRVFDPGPGMPPEEVSARAEALLLVVEALESTEPVPSDGPGRDDRAP